MGGWQGARSERQGSYHTEPERSWPGACILLFFIGENHWRASGREVTEFDLKNKKSLAF